MSLVEEMPVDCSQDEVLDAAPLYCGLYALPATTLITVKELSSYVFNVSFSALELMSSPHWM
ncbi:hypothetical protein Sjap_012572 [Stephania japonica]|uniref:Uncharacterized protein n=1 Tax=Stephania japonica TaxID=461633 RepID=A0AAP0IXF9_9MAGN